MDDSGWNVGVVGIPDGGALETEDGATADSGRGGSKTEDRGLDRIDDGSRQRRGCRQLQRFSGF